MILKSISFGELPAKATAAVKQNLKVFGDDYELIERPRPDDISDADFPVWAATQSDIWRFEQASKDPEFFFSCLDLAWNEDPRDTFTEKGAPYLLAYKGDPTQGESAGLYCNGCCDYFAEKLDYIKGGGYGFQMKALRDTRFNIINPSLFYHKRAGLYEKAKDK